jgi:tetratricopeptide (TPR) repeat protein
MTFDDMEFGSYDKAERKARRAYELYEDGKMPQALEAIEIALEINPANGTWHFNKALTLDAIDRFEEAIYEYETALQFNPGDLEILNSLAVDYTRVGRYDQAIETFERIQELEPDFEPCYCNRIITYTEMGLHDLAEQMFYIAQQIKPNCALCYYNIGNSLFARGQFRKAVGCWLRTAELEMTHPQINYRIAQAYWSCGENDKAKEYFLSEIRLNPGDIDVIFDFGLFQLETGDLESAREKFSRILEFNPRFAPALFYRGEIAFRAGEYEKAVEFYDKATECDEDIHGPRYRLAQLAIMNGQNAQARSYLLAEMKLALEDCETLVSMGSMFLTIGDLGCAMSCLLRAIDNNSTAADAYYYLGLASALRGEFEEASELFSHALDINNEHFPALRDSAYVYFIKRKFPEASKRIERANSIAPNDSQIKSLKRRICIANIITKTKRLVSQKRHKKD